MCEYTLESILQLTWLSYTLLFAQVVCKHFLQMDVEKWVKETLKVRKIIILAKFKYY